MFDNNSGIMYTSISVQQHFKKMSAMSEINLEIETRLASEENPKQIARILNVPLTWVYAVQELLDLQESGNDFFEEKISL